MLHCWACAAVEPEKWDDWRWQLQQRITQPEELCRVLGWPAEVAARMEQVARKFHMAITPYYLSLARSAAPSDPILRQCVPDPQELEEQDATAADPLDEEIDAPVPGLTHRYPDRALFVATNSCAIFCRHCLRKRNWKNMEALGSEQATALMLDYLRRTPAIREVLVSGGDPFLLPEDRLESLLARLRDIPHLEVIRIGTRVPVVLPQRVTSELAQMIGRYSPVWVNTHFNHPWELTPEAARSVDVLLRAGVPVCNQTVLLRGVNDEAQTMRDLCLGLLKIKVKPYYLFHCDPVTGTGHFRTSVGRGLAIMESLRGHISGLAVPVYALDCPGGGGKVPLSPQFILLQGEGFVIVRNYEGQIVRYDERAGHLTSGITSPGEGLAALLNGDQQLLIPEGSLRLRRRLEFGAKSAGSNH